MTETIILIIAVGGILTYIYTSSNSKKVDPNAIQSQIEEVERTKTDILEEQLQYLKNIQYNTERTAKNTAFLTWVMIISFVITLFSLLSVSSKF